MRAVGYPWAKINALALHRPHEGFGQGLGCHSQHQPCLGPCHKGHSRGNLEFNTSDLDPGPDEGGDLAPATPIGGRVGLDLTS